MPAVVTELCPWRSLRHAIRVRRGVQATRY